MRRSYISLPIVVVVAMIFVLYYLTMFYVIDEWLGLKTSAGLFNAEVLTLLVCMSLATYAMAIMKDPGHVPPSFMPEIEDPDSSLHEVKRKHVSYQGGDLRFCQKCSLYKPPRAHHCRICRRCVLRMDHHCVWINNCVGHANYKIFLVFVLYGVVACIHCTGLLLGNVLNVERDVSGGSSKIVYIVCGVMVFPLTVALTVLFGWHIYLLLRNKTTIEYHEGVRAMWLAEKVGNSYRHPYDLGAYENLVSVLGPNMLTWICPTSSHIGTGLRFRSAYDSTHSATPKGHV